MDKFRALQYFVAAAQEGSFSGAARLLDVSVPAVFKMIATLERSLGTGLFDRAPNGLTLTADGARYLEHCQPLLEQLADADNDIAAGSVRPRGVLAVGAPAFVMQNCLADALPRFHARYPDIQFDLRIVSRMTDEAADAVDVFVLFGWNDMPNMVQRRIAQTRYHVFAAPDYWAAHGVPQRPRDLAQHNCLCLRNPEGTLLDLWEFERDGETESVTVNGWIASGHRDFLVQAAIAGEGIVRVAGLATWQHVRAGRLVTTLNDWEPRHAPPVHISYRPSHRRTPRVRLFVDFVTHLFHDLEMASGPAGVTKGQPEWQGKHYGKASRVARHR
jgi:LysR family transcriptional regulator, regulator for bpeEF and oprC